MSFIININIEYLSPYINFKIDQLPQMKQEQIIIRHKNQQEFATRHKVIACQHPKTKKKTKKKLRTNLTTTVIWKPVQKIETETHNRCFFG